MIFHDWGLVDYKQALSQQLIHLKQVQSGGEEQIIFCSHNPVVTLGRASEPEDLIDWSGEVVEITRGGKATYHGPGQLVIYPILNLNREDRKSFKPRDIHAYLRALESATSATFAEYGLETTAIDPKKLNNENKRVSYTGVWVDNKKIASIGIAVKKWVTFHGIAINLYNDVSAFSGINPCGFTAATMTSLESLGLNVDLKDFKVKIKKHLISCFS